MQRLGTGSVQPSVSAMSSSKRSSSFPLWHQQESLQSAAQTLLKVRRQISMRALTALQDLRTREQLPSHLLNQLHQEIVQCVQAQQENAKMLKTLSDRLTEIDADSKETKRNTERSAFLSPH